MMFQPLGPRSSFSTPWVHWMTTSWRLLLARYRILKVDDQLNRCFLSIIYIYIYILYTLRWNTCAKLASRVLRAWGQGNENEMETTTKEIAWE